MTSLVTLYKDRFNILPLHIAFPYFGVLIGLELISHWKHWKKHKITREKYEKEDDPKYPQELRPYYRINDSITSLLCGYIDLVTGKLLSSYWMMLNYVWVYHYLRIMDWESVHFSTSFGSWVLMHILAFFMKDYFYYWFHRAIHEVNIGWASHAPHHNSEEYNLTTALRQGMFQSFFGPIFYVPMAIVGIPPEVYAFHTTINLLWQFWIHTRTIGKFHPIIEWIFNTPSHHRLHHGRNPEAIDKNYGGTLIIFDRLHGTFEEEKREVLYGTIHPIQSFNILTSQLHHFKAIMETCASKGFAPWQWIRIIFMPPGYDHSTGEMYPIPDVDEKKADRYNRHLNNMDTVYACVSFLHAIFVGSLFLAYTHTSVIEKILQWAMIFFTFVNVGYICDGFRDRTRLVETIRASIVIIMCTIFVNHAELIIANCSSLVRKIEILFACLSVIYAYVFYEGDPKAVHEWQLMQMENSEKDDSVPDKISIEEKKLDTTSKITIDKVSGDNQVKKRMRVDPKVNELLTAM